MGSPAAAAAAMPHFCDNSQMPMTMYMDGFRSSLWAYLFTDSMDDGDNDDNAAAPLPPCLTFLLKRWTLDTPPKFIGAMMATLLLGVAAEGMAAARTGGGVSRWAHTVAQRCCSCGSTNRRTTRRRSTTAAAASSPKCHRRTVQLCLLSTHMLQAWVGYVLMLAAMSYSLELLGSVLLGLGLGYATFFDLDGRGDDEVGPEEDEDAPAIDGTATTIATAHAGSGGGNGYYATPAGNGTEAAGTSTSTSCCSDVAGRGPPRRAFPFLRSPVPTLAGVGRIHRRMSPREGRGSNDGNDGDADDAEEAAAAMAMAGHGGRHNGDGADNLSLHEDDKMTPLL